MCWVGALGTTEQMEYIFEKIYLFANKTTGRVPLGDWYDTNKPISIIFKARPVVGAIWSKILLDKLSK